MSDDLTDEEKKQFQEIIDKIDLKAMLMDTVKASSLWQMVKAGVVCGICGKKLTITRDAIGNVEDGVGYHLDCWESDKRPDMG